MSDPIRKLEHDHEESLRHLTRLLNELLTQAQDEQRAPEEILASYQEALDEMCHEVDHFAAEEATLFPPIQRALPELAPRIESVLQVHRTLDGLVAEIAKVLQGGAGELFQKLPALTELIRQFLLEFTRHTEEERALLQQAEREMSQEQKKALLRGLSGL